MARLGVGAAASSFRPGVSVLHFLAGKDRAAGRRGEGRCLSWHCLPPPPGAPRPPPRAFFRVRGHRVLRAPLRGEREGKLPQRGSEERGVARWCALGGPDGLWGCVTWSRNYPLASPRGSRCWRLGRGQRTSRESFLQPVLRDEQLAILCLSPTRESCARCEEEKGERASVPPCFPGTAAWQGGSWRAGTSAPQSARLAGSVPGARAEPLGPAVLEGESPSKETFSGSPVSTVTRQPLLKPDVKMKLRELSQECRTARQGEDAVSSRGAA